MTAERIPIELEGDRLNSVAVACEVLGLGEREIRRRIAEREIEYVRISPRRIGIRTSVLRRMIAESTVAAKQASA